MTLAASDYVTEFAIIGVAELIVPTVSQSLTLLVLFPDTFLLVFDLLTHYWGRNFSVSSSQSPYVVTLHSIKSMVSKWYKQSRRESPKNPHSTHHPH